MDPSGGALVGRDRARADLERLVSNAQVSAKSIRGHPAACGEGSEAVRVDRKWRSALEIAQGLR